MLQVTETRPAHSQSQQGGSRLKTACNSIQLAITTPASPLPQPSNNITGKVKFENMLDDRYRYNPDKRAIIGSITKKKYQIGNKVFVVVKDACKETRTINFQIGKQKSLRK